MRVAVIGGGVCGLGSAYVLAREDGIEEVVLFEKEESVLGGHAKTMRLDGVDLDVGFIVCNPLKEMRLKEQPNDLKKQRLQQSKSAGDKKRVFSVSLEEPLRDSADEDGAGGSCFQEEKMDEISSASVAGETVNDFATKGSSVTIEKIQGGIDIRFCR